MCCLAVREAHLHCIEEVRFCIAEAHGGRGFYRSFLLKVIILHIQTLIIMNAPLLSFYSVYHGEKNGCSVYTRTIEYESLKK